MIVPVAVSVTVPPLPPLTAVPDTCAVPPSALTPNGRLMLPAVIVMLPPLAAGWLATVVDAPPVLTLFSDVTLSPETVSGRSAPIETAPDAVIVTGPPVVAM